jgi:hypothetical protein
MDTNYYYNTITQKFQILFFSITSKHFVQIFGAKNWPNGAIGHFYTKDKEHLNLIRTLSGTHCFRCFSQ